MSPKLIAVLVWLCSARPALAERSIDAEVAAVAPFDSTELTAAMRVRLPAEGTPIRVRVLATPDGVRIEARGNAREVALRGLTGTAAARLVALAANDLLLDDLAIAPGLPLEPPSLTATHAGTRNQPITIGLLGAASMWQHVLGGLGIDLAIPRGEWLLAIEAGGGTLVDGPIGMTAAVVRIGGGARLGMLELRAGATFAPLIVNNGSGDRTILAGAGTSARLRFPIASGIRAVLALGFDVFATRTTYLLEGMPALSTPRGAPWFAAGMEVTP